MRHRTKSKSQPIKTAAEWIHIENSLGLWSVYACLQFRPLNLNQDLDLQRANICGWILSVSLELRSALFNMFKIPAIQPQKRPWLATSQNLWMNWLIVARDRWLEIISEYHLTMNIGCQNEKLANYFLVDGVRLPVVKTAVDGQHSGSWEIDLQWFEQAMMGTAWHAHAIFRCETTCC